MTSIHVVAEGAQGGAGSRATGPAGSGGTGARVSAQISVTSGATLYVEVGGTAIYTDASCFISGASCEGGFNGGGNSGQYGGGGGGASDLRTVSCGATCPGDSSSLNSRLLVVAGGGGGGSSYSLCPDGGESTGGNGGASETAGNDGTACGAPGGGTGGGAGTSPGGSGGSPSGGTGSLGTGGVGAQYGGGGGGGRYGGGGGGDLIISPQAQPIAAAGGGGGGSNYTTDVNATITNDVNSGDGQVTITYTVPVLYNFTGFFKPISNSAINVVKAGSGVAVKFSLAGNQGLDIFSAGSPTSVPGGPSCIFGGIAESTSPAGKSGLSYSATTDTYSYNWKTQKSWKGSCRQLVVGLNDGTFHSANFMFK